MTGTKPGAKRGHYADSLQGRIEAFFAAHPGAWLSKRETCEQFGCTPVQWRDAVVRLRNYRELDIRAVTIFAAHDGEVEHATTTTAGGLK